MKIVYLTLIMLVYCQTIKPSITFTQAQTTSEKQMVGQNKELEKDGWLISSIKTSSSGSDEWQRDSLEDATDKDYSISLKILAYSASELLKFRKSEILGEGNDGMVHLVPEKFSGKKNKNPEELKKAEKLMEIVNDSRKKVYSKRNQGTDPEKQFFLDVEKGEYIYKDGKWEKK